MENMPSGQDWNIIGTGAAAGAFMMGIRARRVGRSAGDILPNVVMGALFGFDTILLLFFL